MKKHFLLLFLISLFLISNVSADMIPVGQKFVKYNFEIENIEDYQDYQFILFGEPLVNGLVIEEGQEYSFYKYASPHIYVIKNDLFDLEEFKKHQEDYTLKKYLLETPDFIKSDLQLKNYGLVSEFDPLYSAKDILKIVYLNEEGFIVVKDKIVYTYNDGSTEIKEANAMNPNPSRTTILPYWTMQAVIITALLLSLAALILIIVLVVRRIRR